jgi:hypothetical protein
VLDICDSSHRSTSDALHLPLSPAPFDYHAGPMPRRPSLLVIPLLFVLTWAVYRPVAGFGFVDYDDPEVVTANPHVSTGLTVTNARWAVTGFAAGHWEPLTWWSLQADASAWHGRAGPMHVENVLLHAAGACVLYGLLATATGAPGRSAVVAALFAVHPMHVESVAWVTERRDVLSTPPLLAAVWAYVRYARAAGRGRLGWYAATLALYAVSLLAKATGMTLPAVLLLVDFWPLRRAGWWRLIAEKLPLAALAIPVAALAVAAQRAVGAASSISDLTITMRLANAAVTTVLYVAKLAVPSGLAVFYPHPGDRPVEAVIAAVGLLALVTCGAYLQRRRRPYLLFGWGWFLVTLAPMSGIAQAGAQSMADRYTYVPSIGLFVAVVWAAGQLVPLRMVRLALAATTTVALTVVARWQVGYWRDTETLFKRDADVTGGNVVAYLELGTVAYDRGDVRAAAELYGRAVADAASDPRGYHNLGNCLMTAHDPAAAAKYYADAVQFGPTVAAYRLDYARALSMLPGRRAEAIAQCRVVLSIDPSNPTAHAALADLLGRPPEGRP